jgi:8-oxo-dGTP pyrophosphatase MutT (NUDIX family)
LWRSDSDEVRTVNEQHSAPVRKAATLILVRTRRDDALEVFMVERPGAAAFGGLHVFPGGKVDPSDVVDAAHCRGISDREASAMLGLTSGGLAFWVAAIRESFEEAGVLFAHLDGRLVDLSDVAVASRFERLRHALQGGTLRMADLCNSEQLVLAADQVHYFSHWLTPEGAPARFDTRFFLAVMPDNQTVAHHELELEGGTWVTPALALTHHREGRWQMIYPTLTTLETLRRYRTVSALLADVQARRHLPEVTAERNRQGMQHDRGMAAPVGLSGTGKDGG